MELLKKNTSGFSLAESLVASAIFITFLTAVTIVGVDVYNGQKKERVRNSVIEETSFISNRIANLIRENSIDYAEYLSQEEGAIRFGDNPAEYEARFYSFPTCEPGESDGDDNNLDGTVCAHDDSHAFNEGFFDTGADNDFGNDDESSSAIGSHTQNKLFLISSDGETKYVLSRRDKGRGQK